MNRRAFFTRSAAVAAVALGVVVATPGAARAEIHGHVKQWLNGRFGRTGWVDGGHYETPTHYHLILDPSGNLLGQVEEGTGLSWTFYPADGGAPVVISK